MARRSCRPILRRAVLLRVLILGGTGEASALAHALEGDTRYDATLSLAGVTIRPVLPRIATRIGGYGGAGGLAAFLRDTTTDLVIDATHPFATQISRNAAAATTIAGIGLLRIARPEWQPAAGDRWIMVPDMTQAAAALGSAPRRVLLTIGRKDLAPFRNVPQHDYIVRSVDAPPADLLPPRCILVTERGPFTLDAELDLLSRHAVHVIVTKNSGGSATVAKLDAARMLGLAVVMVARPDPVPAPHVLDWQAALAWLNDLHQVSSTLRAV